jgi:hypothetical protein
MYGGKGSSHVIANHTLFEAFMNAQGWFKSPVDLLATKEFEDQQIQKCENGSTTLSIIKLQLFSYCDLINIIYPNIHVRRIQFISHY